MKQKMILVDGPERGRVVETEASRLVVAVPRPITPESWFTPPYEPNFDQVIYHAHHLNLFGRHIIVGSVRPDRPLDPDLFEALASHTAKDAVHL